MSSEKGHLRANRGFNRREFLAAAGATLSARAMGAPVESQSAPGPIACLFSKPLGNRPVAALPAVLEDLGVDAVDLTCRGGGHVLPERAADDLPRAYELLKAAGIAVPMITTDITDAARGHAAEIVKTAASLGIRHVRLGPYGYEGSRSVLQVLAEVKVKLRGIADLFKQHGVTAGFQNHSGFRVGAAMWDLWQLIADLPKEAIGSQFDVGHALVEGGDGGWRIGLNLLLPRIATVVVKDFKWAKQRTWRPEWGPMGEGMVPFSDAFKRLKEASFAGPIALHVEYGNYGREIDGTDDHATRANIRRDWAYLRKQLAGAGWA